MRHEAWRGENRHWLERDLIPDDINDRRPITELETVRTKTVSFQQQDTFQDLHKLNLGSSARLRFSRDR